MGCKSIVIDGTEFVPKNEMPSGNRRLVVLDRGWIFAGDLRQLGGARNTLTNVVNVRKWEKGGFGQLSRGAKSAGATLDDAADLVFSDSAMIFCVPISEGWEEK